MKRLKQKYHSRLDESLGMRRGPESEFKQKMSARRHESEGMSKRTHRSSREMGKKRSHNPY